jgi:hypothetical protein
LEAVLPLRLLGSVCESFSRVNALLKPIQHFVLNPSDPARTELYPLGESPGQFKARNVLGRVQDQLLQLTLR